ncbi:site-specific integrase [Bacillus cereus]|nr:site-specific integrase [Bacillus cereus]
MNIQEYATKKGEKRYMLKGAYIGVDCMTGKQVRSTVRGKTKKEVKTKLARMKIEFERNGFTIKEKAKIQTFNELALAWFEVYKPTVKSNTLTQMESVLNAYIFPAFDSYKLDKLTPSVIQRIINEWATNANKEYQGTNRAIGNRKGYGILASTVKRILKYGVSLEVVESNSALNVYIPKLKENEQDKKVKHFTKEELNVFLNGIDALKEGYKKEIAKTYFHLLAFSGLRPSEALALEWVDIDFTESTLIVSKTLDRFGVVQTTPKSKKGNRTIYLDKETVNTLRKWKMYQAQENLRLGKPQTKHTFTKQLDDNYFNRKEMLKIAKKIFEQNNLPDINLHGFRHTHASLLLNAGVGYKELQERLGHEDISLTMNTYSHIAKEKEEKAVQLMEKYMNMS